MLILVESLAMCFLLLIVCVIGIANGPVGSVYFYEPEVQEKVVELGLTTKEKIKKGHAIAGICILIPNLFFVPAMVYFINGARGFFEIVRPTLYRLVLGREDKSVVYTWH